MNKFGENIYTYRKKLGLSQEGFAELIENYVNNEYTGRLKKVSYSSKAISKWERGDSFPPLDIVVLIAGKMGVSLEELFSEEIEEVKGYIKSSSGHSPFTFEEKRRIVKAIDNINYSVVKEAERAFEFQRIDLRIVTIGCHFDELNLMEGCNGINYHLMEYENELEAKERAQDFNMPNRNHQGDSTAKVRNNELIITRWIDHLNSCIDKRKKSISRGVKEGEEIIYHQKKIKKSEAISLFGEYFERYKLAHEKMLTQIEVREIPCNPLCLEIKIVQRFLLTKDALAQIRGELSEEVERERIREKLSFLTVCNEADVESLIQEKRAGVLNKQIEDAFEYDYDSQYEAENLDEISWGDELYLSEVPDDYK